MDSITHSLYKAVAAENWAQRETETQKIERMIKAVPGDQGRGLQPLARRPHYLNAYSRRGLEATDLHITLTGHTSEMLALYLELTCAGLAPPAGMIEDGAEVFLGRGFVAVYADADDGSLWGGRLAPGADGRRAEWKKEVS